MTTIRLASLTLAASATLATLTGLAAPALAQSGAPPATPALKPAVVTAILDKSGGNIGTATLTGGPNATILRIAVRAGGLPPGWHGAHFHAVGDCSDTAKFENAKAHVNHHSQKHGLLNAEGPDEGDLPNLYVNADGSANSEMSSRTPLDGAQGLRDGDGSAVIIHENADDHSSQPIGGAGGRIACAVIR